MTSNPSMESVTTATSWYLQNLKLLLLLCLICLFYLQITVPDTGRPQAAKQVVAKKSSAKVPARQQGGSDGAGGGNGTVDASAVSLHTAMVKILNLPCF